MSSHRLSNSRLISIGALGLIAVFAAFVVIITVRYRDGLQSRLRANLLTVIAEGDHITPPCQSKAILSKVGSKDKELFSVPGGHIGIMAGSGANKRTWPKIDSWLAGRSK